MKNRQLIIFLLLILTSLQSFAQEIKAEKEKVVVDSINFPRQRDLQIHVNGLVKNKYLTLEETEKRTNYYDILDTPEKAKSFAINLALMKYNIKSKYFIENYVQISEDKTKKLWFIITQLGEPGKVKDGQVTLIVKKNDCSVVFFTNHF